MNNNSLEVMMCHDEVGTMHQLFVLFRGALLAPFRPLPAWQGKGRNVPAATSAPDAGRLYALDLARCLAMLFMMQGHVIDALVSAPLIDASIFPWDIWHSIRGYTAPVFLMVSGTVHAFANKRDADGLVRSDVLERRIRWGITLMGVGYLLTFPANRVWDLPTVPDAAWKGALAVNILQLTGAAILGLVAVMYSTRSVRQLGFRALVAGLSVLAITPVLQQLIVPGQILATPAWVLAYLTTTTGSLFPFFPFASYLFFGVAVGAYLHGIPAEVRTQHLQRYGWRVGGVMVLVAVATHIACLQAGVDLVHLDSPTSTILLMRRVGVALMVFSASAWLLQRTWQLRSWYALFGRRSLYIYVIHLVLLYGSPWFDGIARTRFRTMTLGEGAVMALAIIVATLLMAWAVDAVSARMQSAKLRRGFMLGIYAVLAWLLFF